MIYTFLECLIRFHIELATFKLSEQLHLKLADVHCLAYHHHYCVYVLVNLKLKIILVGMIFVLALFPDLSTFSF